MEDRIGTKFQIVPALITIVSSLDSEVELNEVVTIKDGQRLTIKSGVPKEKALQMVKMEQLRQNQLSLEDHSDHSNTFTGSSHSGKYFVWGFVSIETIYWLPW